MRMKQIFEIETVDDKQFMVCLDSNVFAGMIQLNETAAFIVECLQKETTVDEIADQLVKTYEVEKQDVVGAVEHMIAQLQGIGALE